MVTLGISVIRRDLAALRKYEFRRRPFRTILRILADTSFALRLLRARRPDILYVNTIICPWWILVGRVVGSAVVVHAREAEPSRRIVSMLLYAPLLGARRVIVNSRNTKDVIVKSWRRLYLRTHIVYNGFDSSAFAGADAQSRCDQAGSVRIAFVGRLSWRKGLDVLVDALALVKSETSWHLYVAGESVPGADFDERVRRLATERNMDHRVSFLGFVDDVPRLLRQCDVLVVPSRIEPFGNVAVEGQLAGLVVIAADVGGLREIVEHGSTGLVFEPGNAVDLAAAIHSVCQSEGLRVTLGARARESATSRFGQRRYGDVLRAHMRATLENAPDR
jgi:glycosyltransferase involved in cell wall biosynthesis